MELSFPERKVRGWGLPKQEKGGLRVGCKAETPPLERPWTLPSFLCQRKVPKAGLPGKPPGSLRAAFVAFLPELS